ncbi:MAG: sel1 repeat family protein [Ruminobacter sp.]|nr:sel1 repeat family protein [Ruminobacter sp.]
MFFYALMLENEKNEKTDYTVIKTYYEKGCELCSPYACNNLGNMYGNGNTVAQDYDQARMLYTIACDDGVPVACGNLGYMYVYELGVKQDIDLAMKYLEFSAVPNTVRHAKQSDICTKQEPVWMTEKAVPFWE